MIKFTSVKAWMLWIGLLIIKVLRDMDVTIMNICKTHGINMEKLILIS